MMLMKNSTERISAIDALKHPWFEMNGTNLRIIQFEFNGEGDEFPLTDE